MKAWFLKILNSLFSRVRVMIGVTLSMIFASAFIYAFQLLNLNVFSPNTTISSTEVNDNFSQLNEALSQVPVGFSVGLNNSLNVPSTTSTTQFIEKINYDFTEQQLATELLANDNFIVTEDGFYQIMIYPRSLSGDGQIEVINNLSSTIASAYMNATTTIFSPGNRVFISSGEQLSIKASGSCCSDLVLDPETFKIKFIKF